ncbi:MAG: hypothetical protein IJA69_01540 [Clostridia bacterium]|nr:hypothetical protein [Clostridia bacterium]
MEYINQTALNFSKFLYEKYLDKASNLKGKISYELYERNVEEFVEKLAAFNNEFKIQLGNMLRKNGRVVYSNTPFISDYSYETSEVFEQMAQNFLGIGIFDELCKDVKFVLDVNHENAKLYVDYYCDGQRKSYNAFEVEHKQFVPEI